MQGRIAIIGATGRVGRALRRRLEPETVVAVARHLDPAADTGAVRGDAANPRTWRHALVGAGAVVHLCAMDGEDARAAVRGATGAGFAGPLIFASSMAARRPERWSLPEPECWRNEPPVCEDYGRHKRAAATEFAAWPGPVLTLLLPALLCRDDPADGLTAYLRAAERDGEATLPGSGQQRLAVTSAADVAGIIAALLASTDLRRVHRTLQVAGPAPVALFELVTAALHGARLPARWRPHPDPRWRGPHSGGDELIDARALRRLLPGLAREDPRAVAEEIGRRWAAGRSEGAPVP